MGRNSVEKIESLIKDIYIYLELDDFENFRKKMDELLSIHLEELSFEEAQVLYEKLENLQKRIAQRQNELAKHIKAKTDVQKYGHL